MHSRTVLSVLLALVLLVPVAGASVAPASQPHDGGSPTTAVAEDGESGGSASGTAETANYTRLYIGDRYSNLRLKPGESDSVTVRVENVDESSVTIAPRLVRTHPRARPIDDEWVTIDVEETPLAPDEAVDVTVTVAIPEGTELGDYQAQLAFTDERIAHPGQPPRPVHATTLNVDVWREPTVHVSSSRHLHTQIEAGESFTHQITIENTGDEAVTLAPEFDGEQRHRSPAGTTVERSWFEIDAPNEVQPGETATVNLTVTPPADADRGRYDAELDLGITDPARDERDTHWQRVRLHFQVWKQPDDPFEATFEVSEETSDLTLTLSPRHARYIDAADSVRFDVEFVTPDGATIEAERVRVSDRGFVDMTGDRDGRVTRDGGDYAVRDNGQQFVYRVDDPAAGTWSVRIMPHNTIGFGYEVVRNESRK